MKSLICLLVALTSTPGFAIAKTSTSNAKQSVTSFISENGISEENASEVDANELTGLALKDYVHLKRVANCRESGYCPKAFALTIDGTAILAVVVNDDGGTYIDAFYKNGKSLTRCSQGESGDMHCQ